MALTLKKKNIGHHMNRKIQEIILKKVPDFSKDFPPIYVKMTF